MRGKFTHGLSNRPGYRAWKDMVRRCTNPKCKSYASYGGRGITVCERWLSYPIFLEDMGEQPEGMDLDRIDNEQGYRPGNCRWASHKDNCRNRRTCRLLTHDGRTQPMIVWAEEIGIAKNTLTDRLKKGWSIAKAVTTPPLPMTSKRTKCRGQFMIQNGAA